MSESGDIISRKALRKEVTEKVHFMTVDGHLAYDKMLKLIDSAPPVDIAERPRGEWKETGYETGALGITYRQTQCSNCGWEHALPMWWHFCPNCGADMRRGDAE